MNGRYFSSVMWIPITTVEQMRNGVLSNVSAADGAHCSNWETNKSSNGTMLPWYGSDADHRCVPLGLGYFVENECYDTWKLFFDFVKDGLTFDTAQFPNAVSLDVLDNITIADCDKGLLSAYKKVFKRARIFHCADHR